MAVVDLKGCKLLIASGGTGAKSAVVKFGSGNITWTEARPVTVELERGKLAGAVIRNGDETPVDVNFTGRWDTVVYEDFDDEANTYTPSGDNSYTVEDILLGGTPDEKPGEVLESVDTANKCAPYACSMVLTFDPVALYGAACASGTEGAKYTFTPFRAESVQYDVSAGTIQCSGKIAATRIKREALSTSGA